MKIKAIIPALLFFLISHLSANEITLEGDGVIHYKYPEKFEESNRYIVHGTKLPNDDCEFNQSMRLMPGQRVFTKNIAYNPHTCETLVVEGLYTVEPQKKMLERPNTQFQQ